RGDLARDAQHRADRQTRLAALQRALRHAGPQRLALEKLHDDALLALGGLGEVEDLHQPRMTDHADDARLVDEASDELGLVRQVRMQHLDRRPLPDLGVYGLEDRSHPTFPKLADDMVLAQILAQDGRARGARRWRRDRETAFLGTYLFGSVHVR